MVEINTATEGDLENAVRGYITEIMIDPREHPRIVDEDGITNLRYPLEMEVFKPYHHTFKKIDGFPKGKFPSFHPK
jgi:hypothetical protein